MAKWFEKTGTMPDIALSTRVRLARNLKGYPFPARLSAGKASELVEKVTGVLRDSAIGAQFTRLDFDRLDDVHRAAMVERHLASREFAAGSLPRALLLSADESVAIMVNEEDHLRIQVIGSGLCVESCLEEALRIDRLLDEKLGFAFDERVGYLTACPTNLGSGLRLSVMLHLPALTESGSIRGIVGSAGKLGLAVRGLYGEGSEALGSLYQISNALSLGSTEQETAARLKDAVVRIIEGERSLRSESLGQHRLLLEDRVLRAAGILRSARVISSEEAMALLSDLRLGASLGIGGVKPESLNSLLWEIQPYNLMLQNKDAEKQPERDGIRAALLRSRLSVEDKKA